MLVIGAKGFAKQLLETLLERCLHFAFFDDVNAEVDPVLKKYEVLRSFDEAKEWFGRGHNCNFALGLSGPKIRQSMFQKFSKIPAILTSTISLKANISNIDTKIGVGVNILSNVLVEPSVNIGLGSLINVGSNIHHDVKIGEFVEIGPCVCLCGNVEVGDFTFIGASATVLPKVKIGKNVTIGAGAVVTKDIDDDSVVIGVPAKLRPSDFPV